MDESKYQLLSLKLESYTQEAYSSQSRVHSLRSISPHCFVKRDDELGFGISGSKIRKFRSLIADLKLRHIDTAIVIGSAYSNNVLGLVQLLIENRISPVLLLLGDPPEEVKGIHLWIRLFVEEAAIHWISKKQWSEVNAYGQSLVDAFSIKGKNAEMIPEGSVLLSSIPGALSLVMDIMRNEKEEGKIFNRLILDAGTGFQACMTLLAYAWLEKRAQFTIVLMADQKQLFEEKLLHYHQLFEKWLGDSVRSPQNYETVYPVTAKSFGSVNAKVVDSVVEMARKEGILTDPIYSAKLFETAKSLLATNFKTENVLIVHSGGGLSLTGFQPLIAKKIKDIDEKK